MPFIELLIVAQVGAASPVPPAIPINQLGYLPDAPKVAVFCALDKVELPEFVVTDLAGNTVLARSTTPAKAFGPCVANYRPVYSSIYKSLLGISLRDPDEYAPFNTGFIVYHDDVGDYSTNEPIMDGTANLSYLLAAMAGPSLASRK